MILITTSRRPTKRVRTFIKELERVIPNSKRIQRGKASLQKLKDRMILNGFDKLILVETWKGNPGRIQFFTLEEGRLKRKLVAYLKSLSMQVDLKREYVISKLSVELDESFKDDEELAKLREFIEKFIHEDIVFEEREGIEGKLIISRRDGETFICFVNAKTGVKVRPCFTIKKVIWES